MGHALSSIYSKAGTELLSGRRVGILLLLKYQFHYNAVYEHIEFDSWSHRESIFAKIKFSKVNVPVKLLSNQLYI